MDLTFKELKKIQSENCVTIILNTHRTSPDNFNDEIALKNLCKEAERRLLADESKRDAKKPIKRLEELAAQINHNKNLESLVLFVNEEVAQYKRLPIAVEDRVVIDTTFATRDLVKALQLETRYFVLVLNQQKARLIEAFNDTLIKEIKGTFPIKNTQIYSTNKAEPSNASRHTHIMAEYFNRVDKEVTTIRKENSLPVLICSEQSNYHEYLKIVDHNEAYFEGHLNSNRLDESANHIVEEAWDIVKSNLIEKNNLRKKELTKEVSSGKFLSDVNDIYRAIKEGKVQTLFIEEGLFQPGIMNETSIIFVSEGERNVKGVTDDIYDELIELNMDFGGDTVFLPQGELSKFNGFGAVTRY